MTEYEHMWVIVVSRDGFDSQVFGPYKNLAEADIERQLMEQTIPDWNVQPRELQGKVFDRYSRAVCDNRIAKEYLDKGGD